MLVAQNVDVDVRRYLNICLFLLSSLCSVYLPLSLFIVLSPSFLLSLPFSLPLLPSLFLLPPLSSPLIISLSYKGSSKALRE